MDPGTGILLFAIGGIGTVATFTGYRVARDIGPKLTISDMRPALPHEGFPIPIFFYTKPELLAELRKR